MMHDAQYFVSRFQMQLHPEGGWFKEVYRSDETILGDHLPNRYGDGRSFSTSIYYLLEGDQFSSFHRVKSDELWHFYFGATLHLHTIDENGAYAMLKLGSDPDAGELFQAVVKAGTWFAAEPAEKKSFSLLGCTMAPGFDFNDFELAKSHELVRQFPRHVQLVKKFSRHD